MMSTADSRLLKHHLLRAAILTGFAVYIIYLVRTGSLTLYIAPRMAIYVKFSAMGLYATAIYQLFKAFQLWRGTGPIEDCDCDHVPSPSVTKNTLIYGLFILPIALGFLLPSSTLGSSLASKKGMHLSGSDSHLEQPVYAPGQVKTGEELNALFPYDETTKANADYGKKLYIQDVISVPDNNFVETLTTLDLYRSAFIGKTIEISGFVFRQEGMDKNQFAVSRFVMNCCSADSVPYGLLIDYPRAAVYKNDAWIKVRGTLKEENFEGKKVSVLQAQQLQFIEEPDSPYVYPNYDFGL
ncbi:TIGR03943 family putative permease subunit [Paenibacillus solisilvae]|uniref:TIGR03943 family putative permease subunit n=1 Tax=Paenibacillus solisilvae TaxID=2486751 RepID=A0ABW0W2R4_9BACL